MDVGIGSWVAEHRPGCGPSLLFRVVVVLDAQPAEHGMEVIRHVAGGVDIRHIRPAGFIDQDPVVQGDLAVADGVNDRLDPDPQHRKVTVDPRALGGDRARHLHRTLEPNHLVLGQQLYAVVSVNAGHYLADLIAEHGRQRRRTVEHRGHLDTQLAKRGRHLGPDEAHPHDDRARPRLGNLADRLTLRLGSQLIDPGQRCARHPKSPVASSGAEQERVRKGFAADELDLLAPRVDPLDRDPGAKLNAMRRVPGLGFDEPAVEAFLTAQVGLGQGRPSKRDARLVAKHHNPAGPAVLPQGHRRVSAGEPGANDDRAPRRRRHCVTSATVTRRSQVLRREMTSRATMVTNSRPNAGRRDEARSRMPATTMAR